MAACQHTIQKRVEFKLDFIFSVPRSTQGTQRITANFRPAATEALNSQMPLIGIPGFVPWQVRPWTRRWKDPGHTANSRVLLAVIMTY